jgi:hypothetical protein
MGMASMGMASYVHHSMGFTFFLGGTFEMMVIP